MRFLDTSGVRTRFDERIAAADGTELSVDLYLPPQPGSYPILLNRTAADNNRAGRVGISVAPAERWKSLAAQGYIVAAADVRGRGDSAGEFVPFNHEAGDGAATLTWLRKLDECNGKVAVFGSGYGAYCAWAAAIADGRIDAIASISPFGAVAEGLPHRCGVLRLDWLFWMHVIGGRSVQPASVPPWRTIHQHVPLATLDEALGRQDIWWRDWLAHPAADDPFWQPLQIVDRVAALHIPGLHITGWWDGFAAAAHRYYEAAQRGGSPQHLIVGPWDTAATRRPQTKVGGFDFGPRSIIDIDETMVEFFDLYLRPGAFSRQFARSRVFVTGRNEWQCQDAWPVATELALYLSSSCGANTRRGDGVLTIEMPAASSVDSVTHNPARPVEFQPQFVSFAAGAEPSGFTLDQAHLTSRDEALVYTSAPLEAALLVQGCPRISVTMRTTAQDVDLFLLLSDTFPKEVRDLHLCHAAIRLGSLPEFRTGQPIRIELELDRIGHEFLPGHCIRLTVTPSLFPLYARNLQGGDYSGARDPVIADIELHSGAGFASVLKLPAT
jgi:putative CocE/NonD family hydrolase